jgi:O-antigen/teichoic acid export membrane protein
MFVKGISYSYIVIIISVIVGFISIPLLLDMLGAELFGVWILAQSVSGYINQFSFGVPSATGVLMAKSSSRLESSDILKKTSVILLVVVCFVLIISVFLYPLVVENKETLLNVSKENIDKSFLTIIVIASLTLVQIPFNNASQAFIGMGHIYLERIYYAISLIASLISLYWSKSQEYEIVKVALLFMLASIIVKIISTVHVFFKYKKPKKYNLNHKVQSYAKIISSSKAFFYIGICATFVYNIDVILIAYFMDIQFVTQYSLVFKIIGYMILFIGTINSVLAPKYGYYQSLNKWKDLNVLYSRALFLIPIASSVLMMFCVLFINDIQYYWLGSKDNYAGIVVVVIFSYYIYIGSFINTYATLINSLDMAKKAIHITLLEGMSNLLITFFLIKAYGIIGAAMGTLIAAFFTSYLMLPRLIKKITDGKIDESSIVSFHTKLFLYVMTPFLMVFSVISNGSELYIKVFLFFIYILILTLVLVRSKLYKTLSIDKFYSWI